MTTQNELRELADRLERCIDNNTPHWSDLEIAAAHLRKMAEMETALTDKISRLEALAANSLGESQEWFKRAAYEYSLRKKDESLVFKERIKQMETALELCKVALGSFSPKFESVGESVAYQRALDAIEEIKKS